MRPNSKMKQFALDFLRATYEKKTLRIDGGSVSIGIEDVERKIRKLREASKSKEERSG